MRPLTGPTMKWTGTATLGRRDWLPDYRDAFLFKVAYCWICHAAKSGTADRRFCQEPARPGVRHVQGAAGRVREGKVGVLLRTVQGPFRVHWSAEIVEDWLACGLRT